MNTPVLYVLDSYGLIYRSYYAFINKPLVNANGSNVSAIFGFFRIFHSILKNYRPRYVAAAFDSRKATFRHEMYPEYKAQRLKTPEELYAQIPVIEEILTVLGVPILRQDGYEADDVIATLAAECRRQGYELRILSGDKDLMQLVDDTTLIMRPDKSGGWETVDTEGVRAEWGVPPELMLDLLSLTGDKSDNIPGVAGVGEKTACKLLTQYGSLDEIYRRADEISGAMGKKITEGRDSAYLSRQLVTLFPDVPIDRKIENFTLDAPDYDTASRLLFRIGVPSIARSYSAALLETSDVPRKQKSAPEEPDLFSAIDGEHTEPQQSADGPGAAVESFMQRAADTQRAADIHNAGSPAPVKSAESPKKAPAPELPENPELIKNQGTYTAVTAIEELDALIDRMLSTGSAAFDCETTSLDTHTTQMAGFSLSNRKGEGFYVPLLAPEGETCMELEDAKKALSRIFGNPDFTVITHNGKFDYEVLRGQSGSVRGQSGSVRGQSGSVRGQSGSVWGQSLEKPVCTFADTMIAAWLLNPERTSLGLEALAEIKLGLKTIAYKDIVPKGKCFSDVPLSEAVPYAGEDADLTWQLWELFRPQLEKEKLMELFTALEMPLLPVLAEMEIAGIRIEKKALAEYSLELDKNIQSIQQEIYDLVGHEFNIASTKQLQEVLFTERKLTPSKKTKTGFSTDTSVLEELASEDPVAAKILRYRGLTKLQSTYVEALPSQADENSRIHTSFIQTGTATGRLSSRDPNLQNIPVRDEEGRRIRQAFTACDGCQLISADYSQIELVILAHLSEDENLMEAFRLGGDVHRRTAALIFGVTEDKVTPEMRRTAKTINFGVMYGMSAFRLSNELDIPRSTAKEFIDSYFATYSGVKSFMEKTILHAEQRGYVETIMGRRRFIQAITSRNKTEKAAAERVAVNTPIQGSAADIVKKAMLAVSSALIRENMQSRLLLQVHDELILESPDAEIPAARDLLRREMEGVISLRVPLRVSVESGPRWGDFH